MIIRLGTAPRIGSLNFEQFQQHWRTSHADVVSHMPGLRQYQQFHAVLRDGSPLLPYPGFDACSALRFDDIDAMDRAFASQEFEKAVQADEAEFVDKTLFRGVVGRWRADSDADLGVGDVHVMTFLQAPAGTLPEELSAALVGSSEANRSGAIVADHGLHEGRFPVSADVVRVVGYDDVESALAGAAATRQAAGDAPVIAEHLARIVDVPTGGAGDRAGEHERKNA